MRKHLLFIALLSSQCFAQSVPFDQMRGLQTPANSFPVVETTTVQKGSTPFDRAAISAGSTGITSGNPTFTGWAGGITFEPTSATDLACVNAPSTGSALTVVSAFAVGLNETTATLTTVYFIKRSAQNTGTNVVAAVTPSDSTDASLSPNASLNYYASTTGNPSALGTSAGTFQSVGNSIAAPTAAQTMFAMGTLNNLNTSQITQYGKPITLHAGEAVCANLNGVSAAGLTGQVTATWSIITPP